jgi:hypothetical protein
VFAAAISIVGYLEPADALTALQERESLLRELVRELEVQLRGLREDLRLPRLLVLEMEVTLALRQSELAWLRSLVEDIRSGALVWDTGWLRGRSQPAVHVGDEEEDS